MSKIVFLLTYQILTLLSSWCMNLSRRERGDVYRGHRCLPLLIIASDFILGDDLGVTTHVSWVFLPRGRCKTSLEVHGTLPLLDLEYKVMAGNGASRDHALPFQPRGEALWGCTSFLLLYAAFFSSLLQSIDFPLLSNKFPFFLRLANQLTLLTTKDL